MTLAMCRYEAAPMPTPTVQLIYNRAAGGHCPRRIEALRDGFEARGARVVLTECGPGLEIEVGADASHVCPVGGDGTVRHVALALARCGRALPLSVYPAGTVNLLHRERPFPTDPEDHALRLLGEAEAGRLHPASVNDSLFLACASVGPDSRAVAGVSLPLKRRIGKLAYAVAFARLLLLDWRRTPIRLAWEGGSLACEAFYVAKGRYFAGPWSFAPEASLADPLLHVVALERARRRDFARFALALWRGEVDRLPGLTAFTCTGLSAEADEPLPVQADGDPVTTLPVRIALHDTALVLR
jgi:diacylglycerol kinase (ATP)